MSTLVADLGIDRHPLTDIEGVFNSLPTSPSPIHLAHGQVYVGKTAINYTAEFPEDRIYDGIGIIEPGFGGFKRTSRPLRHALGQAGIATVSYEPVRDDDYGAWDRLTRSQEAHARTIEAVIEDVPANSVVKSEMPGGREIDFNRQLLIPHSMGGLAAAPYAEQHTSRVDAIVNLGAAGFGAPTLKQLALNLPVGIFEAVRNDLLPSLRSPEISTSPINLARIVRYYTKNPLRTIGEMAACLTHDVRPTIHSLGEHGVKTAFIAFERDCLIPPNDEIAETVDIYHIIPNVRHSAPQLKAGQVADTVVATLKDLHTL